MDNDDLITQARSVPIEGVLDRRGVKLRRSGQERIGPCPKCGGDDRFSINVKENIWNCRGCKPDSVAGDVIGLVEWFDGVDFGEAVERLTGTRLLSRARSGGNGAAGAHRTAQLGTIIKTYNYVDEGGALLFQVTRHEPKDFRQRRPDGKGDWIWSLEGVRMVPYRLPELIEAVAQGRIVYIVEGEKDVDNIVNRFGAPSTCNPRGAGKWANCSIDGFFTDAHVVIIADNDPQTKNKRTGELLYHPDGRPRYAGWDHAQEVAEHLAPVATSVRVLDLKKVWSDCPDKGDITDWIDAGGTIEALNDIVARLPEWTPASARRSGLGVMAHAEFLDTFHALDYLVEGILQRGYIYALTGATGHAKSAIALVLAELIASPDRNAMFGKHKVEKGRVLYLVGENPIDICMRCHGAASFRQDDPRRDQLYWIRGRIDIAGRLDEIRSAVFELGGVDFVVVDTSAAYFLGDDEQSNTAMGNHARVLRKLTELPGNPCVLVLCHPIKHAQEPGQLLPRGGGAFLAEVDGNLTAWKRDEMIDLHYTKMRGPGFEQMTFKLETVLTPHLVDTKGRIIPTVRAVVVTDAEDKRQNERHTDDENRVLLRLLFGTDQSMADIGRSLGWTNGAGEVLKARVQRAIDRLSRASPKLIHKDRDKWTLTDKGKEQAAQLDRKYRDEPPEPVQEKML
jgi:hypothetical protein